MRRATGSLISTFSLLLSLAAAISFSVSFSLLSLTALAAKCGTEERRAFDDTCKGKQNESGAAEGRDRERKREGGIYYYVPGRAMPPQNNML